MASGMLEVSGTIDLAQFWDSGQSDADTVHVTLSGPDAFRFQPHPGAPFKVTHAFAGAMVKGGTSKPPIDKKNRIDVRLQGIDAPELHFRPQMPTLNKKKPTAAQHDKFKAADKNFRQHFGETAAMALHDFLSKAGASPVACSVRTAVDDPSDVFDTYGRFIGDIFVQVDGEEQDANLWLAANGWAFPTFYVTMSPKEINDVLTRTEAARKKKLGLWKGASANLKPFDKTLVFRPKGKPDAKADQGPVIMPKLFRRRSTFAVAQAATIAKPGPFRNYLEALPKPDLCFETKEFLGAGHAAATQRHLADFIGKTDVFTVASKDLVFNEAPSHVVDAHGKPAKW
jgi:endonuclease YncB( thermonuclease family)